MAFEKHKNRVRVFSNEQVVTNAEVSVWDDKENAWVDVRRCVTGIRTDLRVGEVSRVTLDLLMAHVEVEATDIQVDPELLQQTVAVLKAMDYVVVPRWDTSIAFFLARAISLDMTYEETWQLWHTSHPTASQAAFMDLWKAATDDGHDIDPETAQAAISNE